MTAKLNTVEPADAGYILSLLIKVIKKHPGKRIQLLVGGKADYTTIEIPLKPVIKNKYYCNEDSGITFIIVFSNYLCAVNLTVPNEYMENVLKRLQALLSWKRNKNIAAATPVYEELTVNRYDEIIYSEEVTYNIPEKFSTR